MLTIGRDDPFSGVMPFFHTAELLSFRRAAERLGVSTPAVSRAVSRLEERLGVKLFARSSRAVALTPEGTLFHERCREALHSLEEGRQALSSSQGMPQGELRLTLSPILGELLLSELERFMQRYPRLRLRIGMTDRFSRLLEENLDMAIRVGGREDSSLVQRPLLDTRWVTAAAPSYLKRRGAPRVPSDLLEHNCLRFVLPNGRLRDFSFLEGERETTLAVSGNFCIDHGEHLLRAAVSGLGVAQVLDFMVGRALRAGRLEPLLETFSANGPRVVALMPRERAKSPNVRALVAFLREVCNQQRGFTS